MNFTLVTTAGDLDAPGEAAGGGTYEALLPRSEARQLFGLEVRFVDLETLIHLKRAAGRPKDLERIAELEALDRNERRCEGQVGGSSSRARFRRQRGEIRRSRICAGDGDVAEPELGALGRAPDGGAAEPGWSRPHARAGARRSAEVER